MIILKSAVKEFLSRERRDFRAYKALSLGRLRERVERLPVRPPIWKRLRHEQRVGFIAGVRTRKFCFWYDMGMGKTLLAVALTRYFKRRKVVRRVLVLIPNKINKYEWVIDLKKHSPGSTYTILKGSSKQKWEQLEGVQTTFVLETYGGLVRMLTKRVKVKKKNAKKKTRLVPDKKLTRRMLSQVQGIVMDESIMVVRKKGHGSLMHRLCRFIARACKIAYALNGTPFGRDPTDMWGQMHIIDEGETLGPTLGLFRAAFFNETTDEWGRKHYEFDKKKKRLLNRILANRSLRYVAEAGTLPPVTAIVKKVPLPQDADEHYEQARQAVIASKGDFREMKNAFIRMRQISSGFVGYYDDELGVKAKYAFPRNPKFEQLFSLIEGVHRAHKVVVFHEFTYSGDLIAAELKKQGIGFARLYGKTKNPDVQLTDFATKKTCRVFLLQNASGGFGLDRLKIAKYGIYYESPVGTVTRKQTRRRIERQGSKHNRVFIYDLAVRNTVDEQILDAHEKGIDLFEAVVEGAMRV